MRVRGGVVGLVVVAVAVTACQVGGGPPRARPSAVLHSGYGRVFLGVDECSSFRAPGFTEVSCASERAAARVVARHDGAVRDGPPCPARTDFVLHISERRPASDEDGDGHVPRGYACMRSLQPPHPGDPGAGGGPRTIVGDCLYGVGGGRVRETACEGGGEGGPRAEYQVTAAVGSRDRCPAPTSLYVRLDGVRPVGCARPL
ncbi:hypothetical protein VSS16_09280 [Streptomyces broussonetiae]|uniref:Lipoprotein n=2 Tax=Streptomyces broussonetiae TaxID=2686304 RepID=A0ABV5E7W1_9ACTN